MSEPSSPTPDDEIVRLAVNINAETAAFIRDQMRRHGCGPTEAVRRMAVIAMGIQEEVDAGNMVTFTEPSGLIRELCMS